LIECIRSAKKNFDFKTLKFEFFLETMKKDTCNSTPRSFAGMSFSGQKIYAKTVLSLPDLPTGHFAAEGPVESSALMGV
jgi:hypothetical protein